MEINGKTYKVREGFSADEMLAGCLAYCLKEIACIKPIRDEAREIADLTGYLALDNQYHQLSMLVFMITGEHPDC